MERILIRLPNWLGDGLMARPLLHALLAGVPAARVLAIGPEGLLELVRADHPGLETRPWPRERAGRAALLRELRGAAADLALVLPPSFSSAWFAFLARARERVGFASEGRSPLLTRAVRRGPRGDRHLSEEYLALGEAAEVVRGTRALPPLAVAPEWRERALALLGNGVPEGGGFAVLAPGAAYGPAKRWPAERFAEVGDALAARGHALALCGGAADAAACEETARRLRAPVLRLWGRTSTGALAALCAAARVVVSNDSGLAHVAAAVGAPTVVVFGSTSSAWSAPLGARVKVVQRAPACSPCFRRTCAIGYGCLAGVPAAAVLGAARELAA